MLKFRPANAHDIPSLQSLALATWAQFEPVLEETHWKKLQAGLQRKEVYEDLLRISDSLVCETTEGKIVGMAFLVPSGHPTDIYAEDWSYIRLVTVDSNYAGQGIGRELTVRCIEKAKANGEHTIALHTSEMMHKARHIYESLDFTILRELEPRLGKRYWLYILDLQSEGESRNRK